MAVKYFHSNMSGAPVLSGTAGALIAILNACLIDGFGTITLDSLTITGGVATITKAGGITFERDAVVQIAGITGGASSLNGDRRILSVTATTATFSASGVSNQTAAGTITAKMSPLGWSKPFGDATTAAYKSTDVQANGHYLRVDDTGTTVARVVGYESMTDIATGLGKFPTETQLSGGSYWEKSSAAGSTARNWAVVGDERGFYWWCTPSVATTITSQGVMRWFGDITPRSSTDRFATLLNAPTTSQVLATGNTLGPESGSVPASSVYWVYPRPASGLGSSSYGGICCESRRRETGAGFVSGGTSMTGPYPNVCDNALEFELVYAREYENSIRGRLPGIYHSSQDTSFVFATFDRLDGQADMAGKRLLCLRTGSPNYVNQNSTSGYRGVVFLDLTGPWR